MNHQRILDVLSDHPEGLTIADIAKELKVSRITANTSLHFLLGSREIIQRKVGIAKLHYLPEHKR